MPGTCTVWVVAWAAFVFGAALVATIRSRRRTHAAAGLPAEQRAVLLVRPCSGHEAHLARTLTSFPRVSPHTHVAIRFAVPAPDDAALEAVQRAVETLCARGIDARVIVTGPGGPNNKAHQLASALVNELEDRSFVVVADSDVDLAPVDLDVLLAPLDEPTVGATWAPPVEIAPRTWADRASAAVLDASIHSFALLAALDDATMVGKLFAVRRVDLARVGGFGALRAHLGEDAELSRRLRACGLRVRVVPFTAPSLVCERSPRAVLERYTRWLWVVRAQRGALLASYPLFLAPLPAMFALSVCSREATMPIALLAALAARVGIAALARVASHRPLRASRLLIDAVLADALLLTAFVSTLSARRVRWRTRRLRLGSGGTLLVDE